jgi:hypothetical protein
MTVGLFKGVKYCDASPESRDIGARIVSRPQRVTHFGNNWGRLLRYNAFGWKRFHCNGTLGQGVHCTVLQEPTYGIVRIRQ